MTQNQVTSVEKILPGGGEMGTTIRAFDWSNTPLGSIENWSLSLRTAVSICLNSPCPMMIWWGKDLILLYNDGWQSIFGFKYSQALAQSGRDVLPEIYNVIGSQLEEVLSTGQVTSSDNIVLQVDQDGYTKETHFTYSHSPIFLDTGQVGGVVSTFTETTQRVLASSQIKECNQAKTVLNQRETLFQPIFECNMIGIGVWTCSGSIIEANKALLNLIGYTREDLEAGRIDWRNLTPPEYLYLDEQSLIEIETKGICTPFEKEYISKEGQRIPVLIGGASFSNRSDSGVFFALDLTQRKRTEQRQNTQYAVTRILAEATTLAEAVPTILQSLCESLGWQLGSIWTVDDHANVLRCVDSWYVPSANLEEFIEATQRISFDSGIGLPGRIWATGQPAWISDIFQDQNFPRREVAARAGLHTAFGFPIRLGNDVLGVIDCYSHQAQEPDKDLLQMMAAIGSQIGQFIERKRTEETLRQTGERLRVALKNLPISVFNQDQELRYTWKYNPVLEIEEKEVLGKTDRDLLPKDDAVVLTRIKRQVLDTGVGVREEVKITMHGKNWYYDLTVEPLRNSHNQVIGVTCAAIDITDRKHSEMALQKSETLLNAVLASSPVGIAVLDRDLRYIHINEALAAINGLPLSEHLGRTFWEVLPAWAPKFAPILQQVMETKEPLLNQEISGETNPPGVYRYALVNYYPVYLPDGEVVGVGVTSMDVTKLKQIEQALRESESRFRRMADSAPVFIWMSGLDGHCTYHNQPWLEFVGQTLEEALTNGWPNGIHPDDLQPCLDTYMAAFKVRQSFTIEYRHRGKDGEYHWLFDTGVPLFNDDNSFLGYIGSGIDITDRKRAMEALRDALQKLNFHVENTPLGVIERDRNFRITRWSHSAEKIFGWQADEVIGKDLRTVHEDDLEALQNIRSRLLNGEETHNIAYNRNYTKDGSIIYCEWYKSALRDDDGNLVSILSLVLDVTERHRAEQALRESEQRFRIAQELSLDAFTILNSVRNTTGEIIDFEWRYVNPKAGEILNHSPDYLLGKKLLDVLPGNKTNSELFERYVEVVDSGNPHDIEIPYNAEGISGWFRNMAVKIGDGIAISFSDISQRKRNEVERMQLLERERIAREEAEAANRIKDEFLTVLSHELRSPLNPILGWAKLLRERKFDQKATDRALETIERNAKLQSQLIEDLLDVSRILRGKLVLNITPVNLMTTIEAALETVRLAAQAKAIQIQTLLDPTVGLIRGDANRLQQVIWNLLSNAVKFTPSGGQIEVHLSTYFENKSSRQNQPFSNNPNPKSMSVAAHSRSIAEGVSAIANLKLDYAEIQVKDNGKGISPEFLPHVFEYFRQENGSTTRQFGGLGLGLAIVRHLVELHGGLVFVESEGENLGATFTVRLPLMVANSPTHQREVQVLELPNLTGLDILIVDDETDIRELIAFILEQSGASVSVTTSAEEALIKLKESIPDVLLSDIGMPHVDGYMLMEKVKDLLSEKGRKIPAIALTAYAGEYHQQKALEAGFQMHLAKPVEPEELVRAIARLVGRV